MTDKEQKLLHPPAQEVVPRKRIVCVKASHHKEVPTGRMLRHEIKERGAKDFTVVEKPEVERVFVDAEFAERTDLVNVHVVLTVPLTPAQARKIPREEWPAPERHEFMDARAAAEFYAARQRQGFDQ